MKLENELFEKIKNEINERNIKTLDFDFSIYNKRIIVIINGKNSFDLSRNITDSVWDIGGLYKSPEDKWKITVEVTKKVRGLLGWFDPEFDTNRVIGSG